jgi:hypothetical protein
LGESGIGKEIISWGEVQCRDGDSLVYLGVIRSIALSYSGLELYKGKEDILVTANIFS